MIDDLLGVPYAAGGRWQPHGERRTQALDCFGLVLEVYRREGIAIPDHAMDQRAAAEQQAAQTTDEWIARLFGRWERLDLSMPRVNILAVPPVVAFSNVDGAAVHVGVLIEPRRFLHCTKGAGVTLNSLDRPPWSERVLGVYQYVG